MWDNQTKGACAEDILFSALTPNISDLCIVCIQEYQYDLAKELTEVALNSLYNDEGDLLLDPKDRDRVFIASVPEICLKNYSKLKKYLYKRLEFDK